MPHATDTTRAAFEQWYAENAFDYARHPVGSRDFGLQWTAWLAGAAAERERCLHWCRLGDHEGYATHHIGNGTPKPP